MTPTHRTRARTGTGVAAGLAAALLLTGCASAPTASPRPHDAAMTPNITAEMTPGMIMPDGSTMGAAPATHHQPSQAARMICAAETRNDIRTVLHLDTAPTAIARWDEPTYTCRYQLPIGELRLSVHESANPTSARAYAQAQATQLTGPRRLAGLTHTALASTNGIVILVKDNDTLRVDASALPAQFGTRHQKRTDLAYELASDILGCWTGDHD
jgi:hypothetical protein